MEGKSHGRGHCGQEGVAGGGAAGGGGKRWVAGGKRQAAGGGGSRSTRSWRKHEELAEATKQRIFDPALASHQM